MPPRRVIGIDAGGTKLLGGVVDEQMVVHHRVHRTWRGADRQETLDIFTDAVEEVARPPRTSRRSASGSRRWWSGRRRVALVEPPAARRRAVPRPDERAARPAGGGGQRRQRVDARRGARGGGGRAARGDGLARDRDRRRPVAERRGVPGRAGRGRRDGPRGAPAARPDCPGDCPGLGCFEALVSGNAIGREGLRAAEAQPDSALGRRLAADRRSTAGSSPSWRTTATRSRARCSPRSGERLGFGLVGLVNTFNPEVIVIGGGAVRGGELLLEPARARDRGARAAAGARGRADRARPLRRRGRDDGRGADGARVARMPARAGGWSSARRRSGTSRTSRCACCPRCARPTWWRARTRAGRACCSTATGSRRGSSRTTSTTSRRARRSWWGGCATARWWRSCPTPGCRSCPTRATCWCAACVAAGLPVEVLPGPSAAITALVASGLPADEWHFHGFLPRKKGELRELLSHGDGTLVAFESPRALPATLALLAELDPEREVAVCRELTKAHEEIVRGTAAELAARYAEARRRARSCWCWRRPRPAPARTAGPRRRGRACASWSTPAPIRARRRRGRRPDRHERKRAVPRAHLRVTNAHNSATPPPAAGRPPVRRAMRRLLSSSPPPRSLPPAPPAAARRVGLARQRRGDHPVPQRNRSVCSRTAPRDRHRCPGRDAGGRGGGGGRSASPAPPGRRG